MLELLAEYPSRDELRRDYPELQLEDVQQVLRFAAADLADRILPFDSSAE